MQAQGATPGSVLDIGRLYPFQADGVRALVSSDALLLADDMGLGKTIQAIAAMRTLRALGEVRPMLVVAPAGLVSQWRMQLYEWAPDLRFSTVRGPATERGWQWRTPADIYLVSYETLRSDFAPSPHSRANRDWGAVILDEAQRIKNRDTEIAHVCKAVPRRRAWALTGTPLENREDDLASILEFVQPSAHGQYERYYSGPALRQRLAAVQLRRRKQDVLTDLPPKLDVTVRLDLAPDQRRAYQRAEHDGVIHLRELGKDLTITHVLDLIVRLKQICNFCPETRASSKLDDLRDRLESVHAARHRALVFSQFVDGPFGVRRIAAGIADYRPLEYHGGLATALRDAIIARFKSDARHVAMVLSLKAGGSGLNLQEASYVFHFDSWWNPAVERQAEDRAHRMGQALPVTAYRYVCIGTVEERIEQILSAKQALFDEVVDGASLDLGRMLSREELLAAVGIGQ